MMTRVWHPVALAAVVVCGTAIASGQSTRVNDLDVGKLLVSSRGLPDPNFAESVVLLIQYDKQGAVGLMINRRTKAPISRILEDLNTVKHGSEPVYVGGPVKITAVLGLFRSRKKPDGEVTNILGDVYLFSSKTLLEKTLAASSGPNDMRLYLGYCGWAVEQLDSEVRRGSWWIFDGNVRLVFDPYPDSVWSRLIARAEQQMASTQSQTTWSQFALNVLAWPGLFLGRCDMD